MSRQLSVTSCIVTGSKHSGRLVRIVDLEFCKASSIEEHVVTYVDGEGVFYYSFLSLHMGWCCPGDAGLFC